MGDGRYYQAIDETLLKLETDHLDLYSIHWPLKTNRFWPKPDAYAGDTQLITRWSLQHGVVTTVKGLLPEKMRSDFDVFDFEIDAEDMEKLDSFHIGLRVGYHPDYIDF